MKYKIREIEITIEGTSIRLDNKSKHPYIFHVEEPSTNTKGYRNSGFKPNTWCQTNLFIWGPSISSGIADLVLSNPKENSEIRIRVKMSDRTIEDITPQVETNSSGRVKVSVIIPAYKAGKFIGECLEPIMKESIGNPRVDIEVLVGIDNCLETTKEMSKRVYPQMIRTYFFQENVGPYVIRNTLAYKANGEYLIFFDSDDVPFERMVSIIMEEIGSSVMANWKFKWFNDGEGIPKDTSKMENGFLTYGVFAIRRKQFLNMNGFFPWRTSADAEFRQRSNFMKIGPDPIDRYLFYRRRSEGSLTQHPQTNMSSPLREIYHQIMDENVHGNKHPNPQEMRVAECTRI